MQSGVVVYKECKIAQKMIELVDYLRKSLKQIQQATTKRLGNS